MKKGYKKWTDAEVDYIIKNKNKKTSELAEELNRSKASVHSKIQYLRKTGVLQKRRKNWTIEEEIYLMTNTDKSLTQLGIELNRSPSSIHAKKRQLKDKIEAFTSVEDYTEDRKQKSRNMLSKKEFEYLKEYSFISDMELAYGLEKNIETIRKAKKELADKGQLNTKRRSYDLPRDEMYGHWQMAIKDIQKELRRIKNYIQPNKIYKITKEEVRRDVFQAGQTTDSWLAISKGSYFFIGVNKNGVRESFSYKDIYCKDIKIKEVTKANGRAS